MSKYSDKHTDHIELEFDDVTCKNCESVFEIDLQFTHEEESDGDGTWKTVVFCPYCGTKALIKF